MVTVMATDTAMVIPTVMAMGMDTAMVTVTVITRKTMRKSLAVSYNACSKDDTTDGAYLYTY
jgi:hypothetical protein